MNDTARVEAPTDATAAAAPLLIDVRSEQEFAAVGVRGAVNIPLPSLAARIGEVAPQRQAPLLLCCASGARSEMACRLLAQLGYPLARNAGGVYAAAAALGRELRFG